MDDFEYEDQGEELAQLLREVENVGYDKDNRQSMNYDDELDDLLRDVDRLGGNEDYEDQDVDALLESIGVDIGENAIPHDHANDNIDEEFANLTFGDNTFGGTTFGEATFGDFTLGSDDNTNKEAIDSYYDDEEEITTGYEVKSNYQKRKSSDSDSDDRRKRKSSDSDSDDKRKRKSSDSDSDDRGKGKQQTYNQPVKHNYRESVSEAKSGKTLSLAAKFEQPPQHKEASFKPKETHTPKPTVTAKETPSKPKETHTDDYQTTSISQKVSYDTTHNNQRQTQNFNTNNSQRQTQSYNSQSSTKEPTLAETASTRAQGADVIIKEGWTTDRKKTIKLEGSPGVIKPIVEHLKSISSWSVSSQNELINLKGQKLADLYKYLQSKSFACKLSRLKWNSYPGPAFKVIEEIYAWGLE